MALESLWSESDWTTIESGKTVKKSIPVGVNMQGFYIENLSGYTFELADESGHHILTIMGYCVATGNWSQSTRQLIIQNNPNYPVISSGQSNIVPAFHYELTTSQMPSNIVSMPVHTGKMNVSVDNSTLDVQFPSTQNVNIESGTVDATIQNSTIDTNSTVVNEILNNNPGVLFGKDTGVSIDLVGGGMQTITVSGPSGAYDSFQVMIVSSTKSATQYVVRNLATALAYDNQSAGVGEFTLSNVIPVIHQNEYRLLTTVVQLEDAALTNQFSFTLENNGASTVSDSINVYVLAKMVNIANQTLTVTNGKSLTYTFQVPASSTATLDSTSQALLTPPFSIVAGAMSLAIYSEQGYSYKVQHYGGYRPKASSNAYQNIFSMPEYTLSNQGSGEYSSPVTMQFPYPSPINLVDFQITPTASQSNADTVYVNVYYNQYTATPTQLASNGMLTNVDKAHPLPVTTQHPNRKTEISVSSNASGVVSKIFNGVTINNIYKLKLYIDNPNSSANVTLQNSSAHEHIWSQSFTGMVTVEYDLGEVGWAFGGREFEIVNNTSGDISWSGVIEYD